ncbi:MAG TPA: hypothetical protein VNE71_17595 [Myxococcota bacterium]|nr:hypothetical protein [Myxococcota bacterium]
MFRSRFLAWLALAFVGLFAVACDLRGFRVQLPAFEDDQVRGLWIWKAAPDGAFERFTQIEFGTLHEQDGAEFLPYSMELNGESVTVDSPVERDAADNVTVGLFFGHEPGSYKISSYNAAGESGLSAGTLTY